MFTFVVLTFFYLWQAKLQYSQKVGTNDVFHKVVDLALATCILVAAIAVPTMPANEEGLVFDVDEAWWFTSSMFAYHIILTAMWVEMALCLPSKKNP